MLPTEVMWEATYPLELSQGNYSDFRYSTRSLLSRALNCRPSCRIIVIDDVHESRESAIVIETSFQVCPKASQWRCPVASGGGAIRLEIVDSELLPRMQVPTWLAESRSHVTGVTARALENSAAPVRRGRIETPTRRFRRGQRQLVFV